MYFVECPPNRCKERVKLNRFHADLLGVHGKQRFGVPSGTQGVPAGIQGTIIDWKGDKGRLFVPSWEVKRGLAITSGYETRLQITDVSLTEL